MKKKQKQKQKLKLALINSGIAGALVFVGSFTDGAISAQGIIAALAAGIIIFLTKFRDSINKSGKGILFEFI
jgi:hypothetical protein